MAACKRVAPRDSGWEAGWEGGCRWIGGRLGARYSEGISEAGMLKRRCTGGRPASNNSDVVGVVLKALRIHCAAECHTALMGRRSASRGEKIEAP